MFVFSLIYLLSYSLCVAWSKDCKPMENPEFIIFWAGLLQVYTCYYTSTVYCMWLQLTHIIYFSLFYIKILHFAFRLVDIKITFQLKGINLQTVRSRELPDCYSFYVTVWFTHIPNIVKSLWNEVYISRWNPGEQFDTFRHWEV